MKTDKEEKQEDIATQLVDEQSAQLSITVKMRSSDLLALVAIITHKEAKVSEILDKFRLEGFNHKP